MGDISKKLHRKLASKSGNLPTQVPKRRPGELLPGGIRDIEMLIKDGLDPVHAAYVYIQRLNDDIWEADFGLLDDGVTWLGLVVCPTSETIFASEICDHPRDVNDLANLLAHAMQRPSIGYSRRPSRIRLHDNSAWDELIPHLHELGIEVEAAKRLKSYQSAIQEYRHELRKDRPTEEATSGDIENSYPAVSQWVQGCGWIEIGNQEGLGFTVRALDLGGVVFEDTECRSLTEAMASLESGLGAAMKNLGIN